MIRQLQQAQVSLSRPEQRLLAAAVLGLLIALFGPAVAQLDTYHAFADQTPMAGLPNAIDVLSNLPFAMVALFGFWRLLRQHAFGSQKPVHETSQAQAQLAALFFSGLLVTTVCSGYYHLHPDNTSLALDRLGMVIAFAGLLGLAVADRISARAASVTAAVVMACGPLAVGVWADSGNLLPWIVLQAGGMLVLTALAFAQPVRGAWGLRLLQVAAIYAVAKLLELGDHAVYEWTQHWVSGHSLKHVVAAGAAWPVWVAIQNATATQPLVVRWHNVPETQSQSKTRHRRLGPQGKSSTGVNQPGI